MMFTPDTPWFVPATLIVVMVGAMIAGLVYLLRLK